MNIMFLHNQQQHRKTNLYFKKHIDKDILTNITKYYSSQK